MKQKQLVIALGLTSSLGLVGCGGGSDGDSNNDAAATKTYSVKAIDGYLNGALVWLDVNGDFQNNPDEPTATSTAGGNAVLDVTDVTDPEKYSVIVRAIKGKTIDEDTNKVVAADYVMSAPAGQTHVTPLSTLVHVELKRTTSDTDDEATKAAAQTAAEKKIADQLGIPEEDVLGDYVAENKDEAAVGAKALVTSGTLPTNPVDLEKQTTSTGSTDLLTEASTINDKVKTQIQTVKDATPEGETPVIDTIIVNTNGDVDTDSDKDGVPNADDAFDDDPTEWADTDGDTIGDNADTDKDGDGIEDEDDAMPYDKDETKDTDNDGIGDNADTDDDNDTHLDGADAFPTDGKEWLDTDGDTVGNNADTDDDDDKVLDADDAFPLDKDESVDTDKDGTGNNADTDDDGDKVLDGDDAFPLDEDESVDTDKDGTGNNADTDDDGDNVLDGDDAFPLDKDESVDTDGDKIGNNADTDDDGDDVLDGDDAFPLDKDESVDTDKDGTGNNADTDDDGDGVNDEDDLDPTDPDIGAPQTAALISFMQESIKLYVGNSDEENGKVTGELEEFTLANNIATVTARYSIGKDGTLTEKTDTKSASTVNTDFDRLILLDSGWTSSSENYELKIDGTQVQLYPSGQSNFVYQVQGSVKDLASLNIHDNAGELEDITEQAGSYPAGSKGAIVSLLTLDDKYELKNDKVWFWRGTGSPEDDGQNATSLAEVIASASAGETPVTTSVKGVSLGRDIGAELVTDGVANFYTMNWGNDASATSDGTGTTTPVTSARVGTGTWTQTTIKNEEIITISVPKAVQDTWGDKYHAGDTPIISMYQNALYIGQHMAANSSQADDSALLMNTTAKDALLGVVDIPLSVCSHQEKSDLSLDLTAFDKAVSECDGPVKAITSEMISGKNFHRVKSNGGTRDYSFNADGTVKVTKDKDSGNTYTWSWVIAGDYVKLFNDWEEANETWYWAITDIKDNQWALLTFEDHVNKLNAADSYKELWATKVTEQDLDTAPVTCTVTEKDSGGTYAEFAAELKACSNKPDMDVDELTTVYRISGSKETRAYVLNPNGNMLYFRNGVPRDMTWEMNSDDIMVWKQNDTIVDYLRIIKDLPGDSSDIAFFSPEESEIWVTTLSDTEAFESVKTCQTGDSEWDDDKDRPVSFTNYAAFVTAFDACIDSSVRTAKFDEDELLDRTVIFQASDERLTFNSDKTGTLNDLNESTGAIESTHSLTWSIHDADRGILKFIINYTDDNNQSQTVTQYQAITTSNGIEFAMKGFWEHTAWESESDHTAGSGEIFSRKFSHPDAKSKIDGL